MNIEIFFNVKLLLNVKLGYKDNYNKLQIKKVNQIQ